MTLGGAAPDLCSDRNDVIDTVADLVAPREWSEGSYPSAAQPVWLEHEARACARVVPEALAAPARTHQQDEADRACAHEKRALREDAREAHERLAERRVRRVIGDDADPEQALRQRAADEHGHCNEIREIAREVGDEGHAPGRSAEARLHARREEDAQEERRAHLARGRDHRARLGGLGVEEHARQRSAERAVVNNRRGRRPSALSGEHGHHGRVIARPNEPLRGARHRAPGEPFARAHLSDTEDVTSLMARRPEQRDERRRLLADLTTPIVPVWFANESHVARWRMIPLRVGRRRSPSSAPC